MIGRRETFVGLLGALLLASASASAFAKAPAEEAQAPAKAPAKPPAVAPRFVTPLKGQAEFQYLAPQQRSEGNLVVTRIKVKNVSNGPVAGFKVDEYWYSAKGDTVSGSPTFRHLKPLMPNEEIEVVLRSPRHPDMNRSLRVFAHMNGSVKATQVAKFKPAS